MLSHVFVARTSRIEMAAIATNRRQHIVSMAKKSHHSDLMQVSPISVRVSHLMLLMWKHSVHAIYCWKLYESKRGIIRAWSVRRNGETSHIKTRLPSIWRGKTPFSVYIISFYICISFCLCEFVALRAVCRTLKLLTFFSGYIWPNRAAVHTYYRIYT